MYRRHQKLKKNRYETSLIVSTCFTILVDGNWGEWGEWSTCTKTCRQGKQSRSRECNSPAPKYGGKKCAGEGMETQVCNDKVPCPGNQCIPSGICVLP